MASMSFLKSKKDISLAGVLSAFQFLRKTGVSTPLVGYSLLSDKFNAKIFIKHEECNTGGSFKTRNALYYFSRLSEMGYKSGVVCATRGNFGIGITIAAKRFGLNVIVFVPEGNVEEKNELLKSHGASLFILGKDYDEAKEHAKLYADKHNLLFISTADDPDIIHAAGTIAFEVFLDLPMVDYIIVPIGSGSLAAGTLLVRNSVKPKTKIIGVQAKNANAVYRSWKSGEICQIQSCDTIADGLATRSVFALPFTIIQKYIDDIILLEEDEIKKALALAYRTAKIAIEPASATVFGCLEKIKDRIQGKCVGLITTGKNFSSVLLKEILNAYNNKIVT